MQDADTAKVAYTRDLGEDGQELTIILPDGTTAKAILQRNEVLASASDDKLIASD